jgi:hypothetical protein
LQHTLEGYKYGTAAFSHTCGIVQRQLEHLATNKTLTDQLIPMLLRNEALDLDTLVPRAWDVIAGLMKVDFDEAEYLASIERGEIRTELLFPDDADEAALLASHPAIQWKVKNVRGILRQKD